MRISSSNMGASRPQIGMRRTPPSAPTNADIAVWLKRLRIAKTGEERERAVIEMAGLNNPAALPHLAALFMSDSEPRVQQSAQRFGKILYWNGVYWHMERSGEIVQAMQELAASRGKNVDVPDTLTSPERSKSKPPQTPPSDAPSGPAAGAPNTPNANASAPPEPPQVDVGDILRKANEARAKRKKK